MKRFVSLLLALLMVVSMFPAAAFADTAEEPVHFTLFAKTDVADSSWADSYLFRKMEKLFNVKFDITEINSTVWNEKVSVALATDGYPDFFLSSEGVDVSVYGPQGIIIDLKDLITEETMPNLFAMYQKYPVAQKAAMSYDGHQYCIYGYDRTNTREYLQSRFFVNTQWIRNLGMEEPTTLDEMYAVLKAFKEQDADLNGDPNNEIPMGGSFEYDPYSLLTVPLTAYGYRLAYPAKGSGIFVDVDKDGKVFFVPTAEHFGDALAWMKKLFDEELLDPEYFTQSKEQVNAKQSEGVVGAFMDWAQWIDIKDPALYSQYDGIEPLTTEVNNEKMWPAHDFRNIGFFCVTDKCQNVEKLLEIMDWAFTFDAYCTTLGGAELGSEPGWEDMGYQVEYLDESYGENALKLNYTYPDTFSSDNEWREAMCSPGWSTIPLARVDFTFVESSPTEQALSSALNDNYTPYMQVGWPTSVKFTDDESMRLALLATDIESYLKQMVTKY
ncbi:MAG: extracellular solute-binding protein, partial [Aristaeellaceae bacterium]